MPNGLTSEQLKERVVLNTFDMLSPEYHYPQWIRTAAKTFERSGAKVTFARFDDCCAGRAAVVRAAKHR